MKKTIALTGLCLGILGAQSPQTHENPYTELNGEATTGKGSAAAKPARRTPDGKPDLSGFWKGPLVFGGMFKSVGGPPFTPAGQAAFQYNVTKSINPGGFMPLRWHTARQHQRSAL